ncbi:DUF3576 domain-containing protein [Candidatus Pelagibacter sp. HIMB1509]|uniref:DUF3576 domain-containing protein n=1 Tax=Candidatus Pelagibacter sp. HIMB1509 TaxID=3413339 RepID=UPI003F87A07B
MNSPKHIILLFTIFLLLSGCNGKLPGADARKVPYDPAERVKKNIEEGRGFRLMDSVSTGRGGDFEFASSNELWRASLDVIDFMPLSSVNYSGGMIITDWYSDQNNNGESIKISIRFLTNEVRSDAISIKVFYKNCATTNNCVISEKEGKIVTQLKKEILKIAAQYKEVEDKENFKPYKAFERDRR